MNSMVDLSIVMLVITRGYHRTGTGAHRASVEYIRCLQQRHLMVSPPPEGRTTSGCSRINGTSIGMYQDVAIYVYIYIYIYIILYYIILYYIILYYIILYYIILYYIILYYIILCCIIWLYMYCICISMYQYVSGFSWIDVFLFFFPRFLCEKQTQFAWPWNDRLHRNSVPHPCRGDTGCWQCGPGGRPIPDALCCGPFINFHLFLWGKQRSQMIDLFNQSLPGSNDHSWGSVVMFGPCWFCAVNHGPMEPLWHQHLHHTMVPSWPISQNAWKFRSLNVFSMCFFFPLSGHPNFSWYKILSGWWYTYPSEKWWSSSVGILIPNWMETHKIHVPNHQPAIKIWDFKGSLCFFVCGFLMAFL